MNFSDLGISPETLKAIEDAGYSQATPIQEKAIPPVLMGRDVLGCAQTGTGKTASFTLPMIDMLASGRARARMPRSLIITPTRELAYQIAENFDKYGKYGRLTKALLIGGSSFVEQEKALDRGVDVLIATPGRLLDLFDRGKIMLMDTKLLVIDEADRMLDMGFIPDVERIVSLLPVMRQTLFFSATMAPEIRKLADQFLNNPKEIHVSAPSSTARTITQKLIRLRGSGRDKRQALRDVIALQGDGIQSAILFCNRKRDVDTLRSSMTTHGYSAGALHGDMAQSQRMGTLNLFKEGEIKFLVCSDVAARGLDIPDVSHVFNFDVPNNPEDYVHRIGRTGRAGREGKSFTFALPEDYKLLSNVQKTINNAIEELSLEGFGRWDDDEAESLIESKKRGARKVSVGKEGRGRSKASEGGSSENLQRDKEERSRRNGGKERAELAHNNAEGVPSDEPHNPTKSFGDHTPAFILRETRVA